MLRRAVVAVVLVAGMPLVSVACGKTKGNAVSVAQCQGLLASAGTAARSAAAEVNDAALPCYLNSDCVEVAEPSCISMCSGQAAKASDRDALVAKMNAIDGDLCKRWNDDSCARISPRPIASCANYTPACKQGKCVMRPSWEILSATQCNELLAKTRGDQAKLLEATDKHCKADTDCVLSEGGCVPGCGGPAVAKTAEAGYKAAHAAINADCKKWWDGECMSTTPMPVPSCAPIHPFCQNGTCSSRVRLP